MDAAARYEEDPSPPQLPPSTTPVGVAIARQRRRQQEESKLSSSSTPQKEGAARKQKTKQKKKDSTKGKKQKETEPSKIRKPSYQKPVSSFQLFVATSFLYGACVWLPSGLGLFLRQIQHLYLRYGDKQHGQSLHGTANFSLSSWFGASDWDACRSYPISYLLDSQSSPTSSSLQDSVTAAAASVASYFCPRSSVPQQQQDLLLLSPDSSLADFHVVVVLSLCLAIVRLGITLLLVPTRMGREHMRALVRCKSVNLLSREYPLTPTQSFRTLVSITPHQTMEQPQVLDESMPLPELPQLGTGTSNREGESAWLDISSNEENDRQRNETQPSSSYKSSPIVDVSVPNLQLPQLAKLRPALRQDSGSADIEETPEVEPVSTNLESPHSTPTPPDYDDGFVSIEDDGMETMKKEVAAAAFEMAQQEKRRKLRDQRKNPNVQSQQHLYAAPRMATALFRFLYSVTASCLAYQWFHKRPFWPPYVGGQGTTRCCWRLSGTTFFMTEGGMGEERELLKRYFLWQASYHWHAGAFHIFSLLLLLLSSSKERQAEPTRAAVQEQQPSSWSWLNRYSCSLATTRAFYFTTNERSFAQHSLALILIATTYVFSSLRRLGAIGMFAFDVSSIFLHMLQLCLNFPELRNTQQQSPDKRGKGKVFLVRFLLYGCVFPSFFICRFGILPALWWSAWTESHDWLQQLERTLFPGASLGLQFLWNGSMTIFLFLNMVHLRRLWNHPHLKRILTEREGPDQQKQKSV